MTPHPNLIWNQRHIPRIPRIPRITRITRIPLHGMKLVHRSELSVVYGRCDFL
jgi:hypothetical protein